MRRRLVRHWRAAVAATALMTIATACGSDDDSGGGNDDPAALAEAAEQRLADNPALAELVEAARQEGALNLNWGLHGQGALEDLTEAFQEAYGLELEVTLTPDQNMPGNVAELIQENNSGSGSSTDALLANPDLTLSAGPQGADALQTIDFAEVAPWTEGLVNSDGTSLSLLDQIPGFTYNTTLIPENEVPRTAADVLELDQPIASTPYAAQFNILGDENVMGQDGIRDYLRDFQPAGLFGCGELSRVASGEFAALWVSCGSNLAAVVAEQGAPLETAVLEDAAVISPWYMSVPSNAAHPAAATLWITWLTTPEAQELLYEHELADNSRIEGSRTAEEIADHEAEGVEFTETTYEYVAEHPELYSREFEGELIQLLTD